MDPSSDSESSALQIELDRLAEKLGVTPMPVGLRTNDGLNIYVADDGIHHYTVYERGQLGSDQTGGLDDVLYWFCQGIVSSRASREVGDRAQRFQYEYQVLSRFSPDWAKRRVRELAALFRRVEKPKDLALLPDIGESL